MDIWDYMEEDKDEVFAKGVIQTYLKFYSVEETIKVVSDELNLSKEEILKIIESL